MSAASERGPVPPRQADDLQREDERARRDKRTGVLTLRIRYYKGQQRQAAVVADFEDDVAEAS